MRASQREIGTAPQPPNAPQPSNAPLRPAAARARTESPPSARARAIAPHASAHAAATADADAADRARGGPLPGRRSPRDDERQPLVSIGRVEVSVRGGAAAPPPAEPAPAAPDPHAAVFTRFALGG